MKELKKMLMRGELKEAAEWIKEGPYAAFSHEADLRSMLYMIADAILADKPRPGKFAGQKVVSYVENDLETGAKFLVEREFSQREWERQIYLVVNANTDAKGRVRNGTYRDVAERFDTGEPNIRRIWGKYKNS